MIRGTTATPPLRSRGTAARKLVRVFNPEVRTAYLLILPLLFVITLLLAYPLVYAILLSFQKKAVGTDGIFIGLENYGRLISDPIFPKLVRNTFLYTAGSVALKTVVGMGMALILNERIKGRNLFRGLLMIPWVLPQTVVALNWRWILNSSGVLGYILVNLGIAPKYIGWLGDPTWAFVWLVLVNVWANFPFFGINFLASMQAIPSDLYEAAEVDGASAWQRFIHITIPSLRQIILVLGILSFIWTWNMFTHVWILTQGGPGTSTHLFATYAYQVGLTGQGLGFAATVSVCFLPVLAIAVGLLSPMLMRSREE
jgi:multiple sugar transport system permease protein